MSNTQTDTLTQASIKPVSLKRYDADFKAFSAELGASFARYGFAVVADHGLDQTRIETAIAEAKAFFALPDEVKRRSNQQSDKPGKEQCACEPPHEGVASAKDVHHVIEPYPGDQGSHGFGILSWRNA